MLKCRFLDIFYGFFSFGYYLIARNDGDGVFDREPIYAFLKSSLTNDMNQSTLNIANNNNHTIKIKMASQNVGRKAV